MVILFYIVAFLTVAAALTVVLHKNPVYSALALVFTLFQIAVLFVLLDAHMIAFLQVIVYAGAIVVLFLFVIMLLSLEPEEPLAGRLTLRSAVLGMATLLTVELGAVTLAGWPAPMQDAPAGFGSVASVAESLFTRHLLPFELTSVLLLVAIVGAVVMARRKA